MTNKEILQADILDIIFEKRNKDYGAYALRRGYNHRLLTAIGAAMSVIVLFLFVSMMKKGNDAVPLKKNESIVEIREINLPKEKPKEELKPKEEPKPKETIKPIEKIATQKFTSEIKIKPDNLVKKTLPTVDDLTDKAISDKTQVGTKDKGIPQVLEKPIQTGDGNVTVTTNNIQPDFIANEREPEFPGGPEALKRFLTKNLNTPSDLEDGEKKIVHIRFKVDKDGSVNTFEIITSGGREFDNEVVRVCKKMPSWIPALQNGINVPVSYVLPVTFIGVEQ